jgi:hypothetical protein
MSGTGVPLTRVGGSGGSKTVTVSNFAFMSCANGIATLSAASDRLDPSTGTSMELIIFGSLKAFDRNWAQIHQALVSG